MYFVLYKSKESYRELGYSYFVMLVSKQEVSMWIFFGSFSLCCFLWCRLHSAGHLMDACLEEVGLGYMEPGKGYHFPDGYALDCKILLSLACSFSACNV